jgi:hypothetical protein
LEQAPLDGEVVQVDANAASEGRVPDPAKCAEEAVECRPYVEDDPAFGKLRKNLAKYGPGEDTLHRIVSAPRP